MAHLLIQQCTSEPAPDGDPRKPPERVALTSTFKLTLRLVDHMRADLQRPHQFADERVGFIACRFARDSADRLLILAHNYYPVDDEDYLADPSYGALIGSGAFRKAMQLAYSQNVGIFHIHLHFHKGTPKPSIIDLRETSAFVPDFFHVRPTLPHGAVILSRDSISGRVWHPTDLKPRPIDQFIFVGAPLTKMKT